MTNLNQLLQDGKIEIEDLKSCSEIYLGMLKVLSYSLEEDGINPDKVGITIYSHALIGLYEISKLAQFFKVSFRDETVTNLAATIDRINVKFRESLKGDQLFWDDEFDSFERGRPDWAAFINPLQFCIWNRDSKYLFRPDVFENFFLYFVHGHDITCSRRNNVYNLDNDLGKGDNSNKGSYSILHSGIKKKNLVEAIMESFESVDVLLENLESELMRAPCLSKTPISHFFKRQKNGKKIHPAKVESSYKPSLLKNEGNYPWLKTT